MVLDVSALLSGPRGRHLCLAVAHRLHEPIRSAWLDAARHPSDRSRLGALRSALAQVDPSPVSSWAGLFSFAYPMDDTVSAAMGWQEPHGEDRIAAEPSLTELLEPIAEAVSRAPATRWWTAEVDLETLRYTSRYDDDRAAEPTTRGTAARLARWRVEEDDGNRSARSERPDDPRAPWSGHWWSTPTAAALPTTRGLVGVGSVNLLWEEDSLGQWDALVWRLRSTGAPRIYEIDGAAAWVELVARYPLDVTWSRRHDWYRVTGTDSTWLIPDWEAVGRDFDAVHLTVLGYLTTATRRLRVAPTAATLLAGWDPDQTWWLTDSLTTVSEPEHWQTDQETDEVLEHWHVVER